MRAGKLNRRVRFEVPPVGQDANGDPNVVWTEYKTLWAQIVGKSGLGAMDSNQPVSVIKYSVRIRYRTDITATMRAVIEGLVFEITAVLPDFADRDHTDVLCERTGSSND